MAMVYVRFALSFRNVADLRAGRGLDIRDETSAQVRTGPLFPADVRRRPAGCVGSGNGSGTSKRFK